MGMCSLCDWVRERAIRGEGRGEKKAGERKEKREKKEEKRGKKKEKRRNHIYQIL